MSRLPQFLFCLALTAVISVSAQKSPPPKGRISSASSAVVPPAPQSKSPVNYFRRLLAMSPAERINSLTNRSPETRARILDKVSEYEALGPDERELRLRATELRWYLLPLLRLPPEKREAQLAQVPKDLRELVQARLEQWKILPPTLQEEFLANDRTLHYFALLPSAHPPAATSRQQKIAEQFNQFFELTAEEKEQTLNTLSEAERAQMQKTLQSFEKLPAQQRFLCVHNYAKFASMSAAEQAEFLKNAESWSKMSPQERQTWRDLVENVPLWPPLPPGLDPRNVNVSPAAEPPVPAPSVATNSN